MYILLFGRSCGYNIAIPPQFKNAVEIRLVMGDIEMGAISSTFIAKNLDKFEETYDCLSDEFSRNTMLAYLGGKLSHNGEPMF
jgi:hypothetical protein